MGPFRTTFAVIAVLCGVSFIAGPAAATGTLQVVATIADLQALTRAVGGDQVDVEVLARGTQNPHDLEVRPSLMLKLRRADALIINGLELDDWAHVAVQGANNPRILPSGSGLIDASRGVPVQTGTPRGFVARSPSLPVVSLACAVGHGENSNAGGPQTKIAATLLCRIPRIRSQSIRVRRQQNHFPRAPV